MARISHELSINNCSYWDEQFDATLGVLQMHLVQAEGLDPVHAKAVLDDLEAVRRHAGTRPADGTEARGAVARLKDRVVQWCNQKLATANP